MPRASGLSGPPEVEKFFSARSKLDVGDCPPKSPARYIALDTIHLPYALLGPKSITLRYTDCCLTPTAAPAIARRSSYDLGRGCFRGANDDDDDDDDDDERMYFNVA